MRKILLSVISVLATVASAAKISVMASGDSWKLVESHTYGYINSGYSYDFGYAGSNSYEVDEETKTVSFNAALGLYSSINIPLSINLFGLFIRNFNLAITPFEFNPISVTATWAHPIAVSQGEDMSGTIDIGYNMNVGNVELQYSFNDMLPSVSLLNYINDDSDVLYPSNIYASDAYEILGIKSSFNAFKLLWVHILGGAPEGWKWSKSIQEEMVYDSDPYATFNLGDWLNENTNTVITTEGNYIDTIDLFANYNEEQNL
jgi:hypothetical protein